MRCYQRFTSFGLLLAAFLVAPGARAQERFGKSGTLAVSAERLFGFTHASTTIEGSNANGSQTDTWTTLSLLGASLGYFTSSNSSEFRIGDVTQEEDGPSLHGLLFAPRVGYAFMFQEKLGVWPRGGFTLLTGGDSSANDTIEVSGTVTALTLEVPLVIAPAPHVAFTVGPTFDIGLGGSMKNEFDSPIQADTEFDLKQTEIGVYAGMVAYF